MIDSTRPIRCFIVDDDEDDQEILSTAMSGSILTNHICSFASDGEEALSKLQNELLPDLIFLDLNMPRMGGIECLSEMQQSEQLRQIPVVIYTTTVDESAKAAAMQLGAMAFITKPTRISELVSILNDFFTTFSK